MLKPISHDNFNIVPRGKKTDTQFFGVDEDVSSRATNAADDLPEITYRLALWCEKEKPDTQVFGVDWHVSSRTTIATDDLPEVTYRLAVWCDLGTRSRG